MSSSFVQGRVVAREEDKGTCANHYFIRRIDDSTVVRATLDNRMRKSCLDTYAIKIAIGSYVLMYPQGEGELFVIVKFAIADILSINVNDFLRLNGEDLGGLVKVNELSDKIIELEKQLNEVQTKFNAHVHTNATFDGTISGNPAEGTLKVPAVAMDAQSSVIDKETKATIVGKLSNKKVKHGEL